MGCIHSKPIKGRPLPNELLNEMNQFMPLNGLIKCGQANSTLSALAIPRARKVHAKLISRYFADIFTLVIWFKQWAHQVAEVRANIHRQIQTFNRLTLDRDWLDLFRRDLEQFYNLLRQCQNKTIQILNEADRVRVSNRVHNILARFNFPMAFQNELHQIRASHIEKALVSAEFELSQWRLENIPSWNEMLTHFRGLYQEDFSKLGINFLDLLDFANITHRVKGLEDRLKGGQLH